MRVLATVALASLLGLGLVACGSDDEPADQATVADLPMIGRNAPNVVADGDGRRAKRQELEQPIEEQVRRVRCPSQVALGEGARFTCAYSDPKLGTGAILVEQIDAVGTLEYSALPRSSTEFDGTFTVEP